MLTVWCVCTGDKYPVEWVYRLRDATGRHLNLPHQFRCLSEKTLPGVATVAPVHDWPNWWPKLELFRPGVVTTPWLYFDLDTVIVGKLDKLVEEYTAWGLAMTKNWSPSGHGGWQSSMMLGCGNARHELYTEFDFERDSTRLWGDQEWISEHPKLIRTIEPGLLTSYKYHVRPPRGTGEPPKNAVAVTFHGPPKQSEVQDQWVSKHWH